MNYSRILILLLTSVACSCLAQQKSIISPKNKITYMYDKLHGNSLLRVDFHEKGEFCTSFDVIKENPYKNLPFPIKKLDWTNLPGYDIANVAKEQLQKDFFPNHTPSGFYAISLSTNCIASYKPDSFVGLVYVLRCHDSRGATTAAQSTMLVLDEFGQIIFKKVFPYDCSGPVITANGRYVGFAYGVGENENLERVTTNGAAIYDMITHKPVIDKTVKPGYYIDGVNLPSNGNIISCGFIKWNSKRKSNDILLDIYDFNHMFRYSKSFDGGVSQLNYRPHGIEYRSPTGAMKVAFFDKDFEKEAIR